MSQIPLFDDPNDLPIEPHDVVLANYQGYYCDYCFEDVYLSDGIWIHENSREVNNHGTQESVHPAERSPATTDCEIYGSGSSRDIS